MTRMTPDELMADYIEAFRGANKLNEPPEISYYGGWFYLKSPRTPRKAYRMQALMQMRDNLRARGIAEENTSSAVRGG